MLSDMSYRLTVVVCLIILFVLFSAVDDGYCTTTSAIAVGKDEAYSCIEYWFNRYQSFIGAIATLIAAFFAYRAVQNQVAQNERHASTREDREADAARAVLPLALSAICDYAVECMKRLDMTATPDVANAPWPTYIAPKFPDTVILPLQDGVRHSDRNQAKKIADLIAEAQIQSARMRDLTKTLEDAFSAPYRNLKIQLGLFDAAALYARAAALFDYARGSYARIGTSSKDLKAALVIAQVIVENYDYLNSRIESVDGMLEDN